MYFSHIFLILLDNRSHTSPLTVRRSVAGSSSFARPGSFVLPRRGELSRGEKKLDKKLDFIFKC